MSYSPSTPSTELYEYVTGQTALGIGSQLVRAPYEIVDAKQLATSESATISTLEGLGYEELYPDAWVAYATEGLTPAEAAAVMDGIVQEV